MKRLKFIMLFLLFLISLSNLLAQNIQFVGSYDDLEGAYDVSVTWPYAYICQHVAVPSFVIIDISDPEEPEFVGALEQLNASHDIEIRGQYAYLANDSLGFQIIDISDPYNPFEVSAYQLPDRAYKTYVNGDLAYVADGYAGLYIIDISEPEQPLQLGWVDTPFSAAGVLVRNDIAYVADHDCVLRMFDISDPARPIHLGNYQGEGYARRGTALVGDYAFVPAWNNGLKIIDIHDPENPELVGTFNTSGPCLDIYAKNLAYISNHDVGIQVLDISVPSDPVFIGAYNTPGHSRGITVEGEYIFVADLTSLQILRLGPMSDTFDPTEEPPRNHTVFQNYPNPFNASTTIRYALPEESEVTIEIYDILGRKIETLVSNEQPAGSHTVVWETKDVSSGVYFYRIEAGEYSQTQKCVLLK